MIRHLEARQDVISAAYFIGEESLDASDRFLEAVEAAFKRLADMPGLGTGRDFGSAKLAGLKMWPVAGFRKYGIYYLVTEDTVEILRVLHGARHIAALFEQESNEDNAEDNK